MSVQEKSGDTDSDTDVDIENDTGFDENIDSYTDTKIDTDTDSDTGTDIDIESDTNVVTESDASVYANSGTDTDSDTNINSMSDSGSESGSSADTLFVIPDDDWIDQRSNSIGFQGNVYSFSDKQGSAISLDITSENRFCVSGEATQIPTDSDYDTHWGAGFGFDLCKPSAEYDGEKVTLAECERDLTMITGVRATITGNTIPATEIRIVFEEKSPESENSYIVFDAVNNVGIPVDYLMQDASVQWQASPEPMVEDHVVGIQFHIATRRSNNTPFEFCVSDVEMITE